MKKRIDINGITTTSGHKDGDCSRLVNLRKKYGVLRPVTPRKIVKTLNAYYEYLFQHNLPQTGKNLIGLREKILYLTGETETALTEVSSFKSITQIGNLLNVLDGNGLQYLFWVENEYKVIKSNFGGAQTDTELLPVKVDLKVEDSKQNPIVYKGAIERVYADTNASLADEAIESVKLEIQGLFTKALTIEAQKGYLHGFMLACTAIELFDGNYIMHSQPVLLGQSLDYDTRYERTIAGSNRKYSDYSLIHYKSNAYGICNKGPLGTDNFELDENNSFELKDGINLLPGEIGNFFSRNRQVGAFGGDILGNHPDTTGTNAYWTEITDDPSVGWYKEKFYDYNTGDKVRTAYDAGGGAIINQTFQRTDVKFDAVTHPNMVGFLDVIINSNPSVTGLCPVAIVRRSSLSFKINSTISNDYKPLVKSISVFVTNQVYSHAIKNGMIDVKRTGRVQDAGKSTDNYMPVYKTNAEILKELSDNQQFYKVHEISFEQLQTLTPNEWITISSDDLKDKLGDNLVNQEELTVDNFTHHTLKPNGQFVYNSKLHVWNYAQELFHGWPLNYFHINNGLGQFLGVNSIIANSVYIKWAKVKIKTETGISEVVRGVLRTGTDYNRSDLSPMLSYPDSRAVEITLYDLHVTTGENGFINTKTFKLQASESHNFAYYIDPDLKPILFSVASTPSLGSLTLPSEQNKTLIYRNALKISTINNPFLFPSDQTHTIGTGWIRNVSTNAVRMSEGQFGQYPLFVFTSEGIYSLDTGTTIAYNSQSPASLEIPVSDLLCSTPMGVIFIGKRGALLINGNQVHHITAAIEEDAQPTSIDNAELSFLTYIETLKAILYDYKENEIIFVNTVNEYNWVLNISQNMFYLTTETIVFPVSNTGSDLQAVQGIQNVITPAWDENVITPAWDENVITPAWDEVVVITPAYDEWVVESEEGVRLPNYLSLEKDLSNNLTANFLYETNEDVEISVRIYDANEVNYQEFTFTIEPSTSTTPTIVGEFTGITPHTNKYDYWIVKEFAPEYDGQRVDDHGVADPLGEYWTNSEYYYLWEEGNYPLEPSINYTQWLGGQNVHHDRLTETIHHEAVTETIHHDEVTETIHHEAVTIVIGKTEIKDFGLSANNMSEISLITRPIYFGVDEIKKVLRSIIRGIFMNVRTETFSEEPFMKWYGSRDGIEHRIIGSFRIPTNMQSKSFKDFDSKLMVRTSYRNFSIELKCMVDERSRIEYIDWEISDPLDNDKMR